ncbi:hypothetical protein FB45DRAFT_84578 [Roridomyces roridus]|uniref:DUF6699 domain-containing protein n=1 Tax=Roridomyces roridus TaxID=1738132 RepID=A0AAD7FK38_9AGAR|nr:hypothetical protein FB45DRAFT_84578 [Roridomyces roridus]
MESFPYPPKMSPRQVHWRLTVEQYSACNSPEAWTSPLPSPPQTPERPETSALPLPPTPHPSADVPLPPALELHEALTPEGALRLDFSFPSESFRRNPQLTQLLLSQPACRPPRQELCIRIAAGLFKSRIEVTHTLSSSDNKIVTVGDVLTRIQAELRQYDYGAAPTEAAAYKLRRIETVCGYRSEWREREAEAEEARIAAERAGDGRIVDHLLGHTLFAGLTPLLGQPDHWFQLELTIPERYAAQS